MITRSRSANAHLADRLHNDITDGWVITAMLERNDELAGHGPVRTQHDMGKREIKKLEKQYGCKINMNAPQVKRSPDDSRVYDSFFMIRHNRRAAQNAAF